MLTVDVVEINLLLLSCCVDVVLIDGGRLCLAMRSRGIAFDH